MGLLSEEFLSKYRGKTPAKAGVLFYPVYLRTYSRWLEDLRRRERWDETVQRVVEYSMSLYQGPASQESLKVEAELLYDSIFNLKVLPAGRTLWVGGTKSAQKFGESQFNCFSGDTEFLTSEGYKKLNTFQDGEVVKVLGRLGGWKDATVRSFGTQKLVKLTLRRGSTKTRKEIFVTPNHRWLVRPYEGRYDVENKLTSELVPGDLIPITLRKKSNIQACSIGIQHGMVFGDGTYSKDRNYCSIALQHDSQQFASIFSTGSREETGSRGGIVTGLYTRITNLPSFWKTIPDISSNSEYLLGFLMGWFGADGSISKNGSAHLSSSTLSNLEWAKSAFALLGMETGEIRITREKSPYDNTDKPLYDLCIYKQSLTEEFFLKDTHKLAFSKAQTQIKNWTVVSVEGTNRIETVWCVQEPDDECFVLSGGILTRNCSFRIIDDLEAFTDLFHLLLCGCGVGFRVLNEDIINLPKFNTNFSLEVEKYNPHPHGYRQEQTTTLHEREFIHITVGDSREGWVQALREFLNAVAGKGTYTPPVIYMNFSNVRPAGERIKTFGGLAPGPEGVIEMFNNIAKVIKSTDGTLSAVDCMDICNYIGKNVIVGGTRRSSQVTLGDPNDQEFMDAKKDLWTKKDNLQRTMSNNSVVFRSKPTREQIANIFTGIKNNGEPGFFNLEAAQKRRPNAQGSNPCLTKDSWIHTAEGPRQIKDLMYSSYFADVNGQYKKATSFWSTGVKSVYLLKTVDGYEVKLTDNHKVLTSTRGWQEAKDLIPTDKLVLNNLKDANCVWGGEGTFKEGWLLGSLVGDGTYANKYDAKLRYWGQDQQEVATQALSYMSASVPHRSDCQVVDNKANGFLQVGSVGLGRLAEKFGITKGNKVVISSEIEQASSDFYAGFLQGLFDADGSVQGNEEKGRSVRLSQVNLEFLKGIQRMLLRLGIKATLHADRIGNRMQDMPDGKGGKREYYCQALHELIISRSSMEVYNHRVGFSEPTKKERLERFLVGNKRKLYTTKYEATFLSLDYLGEEEVFDCTVADIHRFDANGIIVHNCMEISMDSKGFCNLTTVNLMAFVDKGFFNIHGAIQAITTAVRIGARMTNVSVSLLDWDAVQKRDRLLGVSITGVMDAFDALGIEFDSEEAINILRVLRDTANKEARDYAFEMRIPAPLLVTTIKPEGTLSQLPTVSSGLHRAYAPYYIRRIRVSSMDPVCKALQKLGVPNEPDKSKPERIVFSFPIKTEAKTSAADEPAKRQFQRYLTMMRVYVDHNASCTLTIGDGEWEEMEQEVYDNFDNVIACAFLPKYTDAYPQMPYEEITKDQYDQIKASFPSLDTLPELVNSFEVGEFEDELEDECKGGACPIR